MRGLENSNTTKEGLSIQAVNTSQSSSSQSKLRALLKKQKYQLYSKSVAVKKCLWTHKALREEEMCYKATYGIQSHRCIQMTPVPTDLCSHQCLYCWRVEPQDIGIEPRNPMAIPLDLFDLPEVVFKGLLWCWKRIISGYKSYININRYQEAENPKHVALSLAGEPALYPYLGELLSLIQTHGMTSFLVTNGTFPERLHELIDEETFPTQLYITIPAPDEPTYRRTCRPLIRDGWQRLQQSLELVHSLDCRTVARLTLVKGINMENPQAYAKLIDRMDPAFIEVKGAVHVGFAQKRIKKTAMPYFEDIIIFTNELRRYLGDYKQISQKRASLISILSNEKHTARIPGLEVFINKNRKKDV